MKKNLGLSIFVLVLVFFFGCAGAQRVETRVKYKKGLRVQDRVEVGDLVRVEYNVDLIRTSKTWCWFRIEKTEYRKKLVTPQYQEIRVTERDYYDPNTAELIADAMSLPIRILVNERPAGTHTEIKRTPTARYIDGEIRVNGEAKVEPEIVQNSILSLAVNRSRVKGRHRTNNHGIVKIPAEIIADSYLVDRTVELAFEHNGINVSMTLGKPYLERILNLVYDLGW